MADLGFKLQGGNITLQLLSVAFNRSSQGFKGRSHAIEAST